MFSAKQKSNVSFFNAKKRQPSVLSAKDAKAIDDECETMEINEENFRGSQLRKQLDNQKTPTKKSALADKNHEPSKT